MKTIPIHNPVVPFLGQIPGGMRNGLVLKIRGTIQGCSSWFQIDLQKGPAVEPQDDVMLHLSIRPQENSIVRNHFFNKQYGCEELSGGCPVRPHESFEITIVAEAALYKVLVNGQDFCTFNHRLSMDLAKFIYIRGACIIQYILVEDNVNNVNGIATIPIHYPALPYLGQIPSGMRNGLVLKIRGVIHGSTSRLSIDLQQGPAVDPQDDIMLHLSIRPQHKLIARNHFFNKQYGCEERSGESPIEADESFELTIVAEADLYKVLVNGQNFCTFNHRLPMHLAQYIAVQGIGDIQYILVENDVNQEAKSPCCKPIHQIL